MPMSGLNSMLIVTQLGARHTIHELCSSYALFGFYFDLQMDYWPELTHC